MKKRCGPLLSLNHMQAGACIPESTRSVAIDRSRRSVCMRGLKDSLAIWWQVRYVVGECFYHAAPEEAEQNLQDGKRHLISHLILNRIG